MQKTLLITALLTGFITILATNNLQAQNIGQVAGIVIDAITEEPLIGASVVLDGTDMGSTTDLDGFFKIDNIPTKSYNITASYIGYKPVTRFSVVIKSAGNPDLNFQLTESVTTLEEIVVRPDPFTKQRESPLSVQTLTTEEIIAYPGGNNDIAKVVQSFPGVSSSVAGFRNDIIIRGGAPSEVVYYLDGIEIPNINHFATQGSGGGPVSLLNVSFFDGVELNTSAFSAQYDNALSGVLQFNQRNGNAREARRNIRISGSEAALTLEGPLFNKGENNSNTSYILSARRSYLQFLFKLIGLPFLPDYWDFQAKVDHKIDDYNDITFIGLGSIDDFSINVPDSLDAESRAQLDEVPVIRQWSNTLGMSWRKRFKSGKGFMRNSLSYNVFNNVFEQYADNENETGLFFSNDSKEQEIKLRSEITTYVNDWKVIKGGTLQRVDYQNTTNDINNDLTFTSNFNFYKYGLFAQASKSFSDNQFSLSFGIRFDANSFTDSGNEIWKTLSPRAAVSLRLDEDDQWRLNASVGRYFKLPAFTILGFQDRNGNFVNQDADYIRSDHFVTGLEFIPRSSTRINLEAFYKKYDNYPVSLAQGVSLANLGADFEVLGSENVQSIGLGRTYGLEFLFQQKLTSNFFAIFAYTLFNSEYTGTNEDAFLPAIWDSRHLISFTGGYQFGNNWELGLKYRFSGSAPFAPLDLDRTLPVYPQLVLDYSNLGTERLESFSSMDVRIDKKWNFKKWSFDLYFDVQNVLGANLPQPPAFGLDRAADGTIIMPRSLVEITEIDNSSVLPTLGFIIDF